MKKSASQRIAEPKYQRVSRATEGLILKLADAGKTQTEIAAIVGVTQSTISRTLSELTDTRPIARALLHKHATAFAERVVKDADVDQSLEMLDRLDVAPRKQRDSQAGQQTLVVVNMPGQTAFKPPVLSLSPSVSEDIHRLTADSEGQQLT